MARASQPEGARVLGLAPRSKRSRTFSASGAAIINAVVPSGVRLFGSSPESSKADNCCGVPNNAVRTQGAVPVAPAAASRAPAAVWGRAASNAITAQQLPAYDTYSSFSYGKPVEKYSGLIWAGEIIRVWTRQVPSEA